MRHVILGLVLALGCGGLPEAVIEDEGTAENSVELVDEATAEADGAEALKADAAGLTATQAKLVLQYLDEVCADTWCSGDYNWQFKKIVCTFGQRRCTVTMLIDDRDGTTWWRSVRITNVPGYKSLVEAKDLRQSFYDKVNRAITLIEEALAG